MGGEQWAVGSAALPPMVRGKSLTYRSRNDRCLAGLSRLQNKGVMAGKSETYRAPAAAEPFAYSTTIFTNPQLETRNAKPSLRQSLDIHEETKRAILLYAQQEVDIDRCAGRQWCDKIDRSC